MHRKYLTQVKYPGLRLKKTNIFQVDFGVNFSYHMILLDKKTVAKIKGEMI